jgi:enamine deaminase RidA (YjgF/YER057c/UK114 family)
VKIAYTNLQDVLAQFGVDMSNIVDETYFVTNMEEFMGNVEDVYSSREAAYGGKPEVCQTLIQVSALAHPDLKIEIKCTAHL